MNWLIWVLIFYVLYFSEFLRFSPIPQCNICTEIIRDNELRVFAKIADSILKCAHPLIFSNPDRLSRKEIKLSIRKEFHIIYRRCYIIYKNWFLYPQVMLDDQVWDRYDQRTDWVTTDCHWWLLVSLCYKLKYTLRQMRLFLTRLRRVTSVCVQVNKASRLKMSMSIMSQFW